MTGSAAFPEGTSALQHDVSPDTLLLIESRGPEVAWSEPRDMTREETLATLTTINASPCHVHENFFYYEDIGTNVVFSSGATQTFFRTLARIDAEAMLSADGLDAYARRRTE